MSIEFGGEEGGIRSSLFWPPLQNFKAAAVSDLTHADIVGPLLKSRHHIQLGVQAVQQHVHL